MSKIFENVEVQLDESLEDKLSYLSSEPASYRILRKSVDARHKKPRWVYSLEVFGPGEVPPQKNFELAPIVRPKTFRPPIVIGAGPAGLFAALRLVERGIPCLLFEQGSAAQKRMLGIARYWRYGELNARNNVCFGEGGAGLYSDGKLITRIKSPHIPYVLHRLVQFGAPAKIEYLSNPHVGSDRIRRVIPPLRDSLTARGAQVVFDAKVQAIEFAQSAVRAVQLEDGRRFETDHVVLATGHSATDILMELHRQGVFMEGKSFALGLRIEHPQKDINELQFGDYAEHPALGAANYRLADHDAKTGIGVYSFCMCPGGYVISSGTESEGLVSNGMSNYARNSPFANAAVVVSVDHDTWFGGDLFGGIRFRSELERKAQALVRAAGGTKQLPAQRVVDFLQGRVGTLLPTSSPSGAVPTRLDALLPREITSRLAHSLQKFQRGMPGFISPRAQFHGVETRTSCPVRVTRDKATLQSVSHRGLYPTGEGAGYAGGITSAAVDGVRVAEAIASTLE